MNGPRAFVGQDLRRTLQPGETMRFPHGLETRDVEVEVTIRGEPAQAEWSAVDDDTIVVTAVSQVDRIVVSGPAPEL